MERRFIKERQREGIQRARSVGVYKGGKARIDPDRIIELVQANVGVSEIATLMGCSRMQVYRIMKRMVSAAVPPEGQALQQ